MAGGVLNLVAYGSQNVLLNGNPQKTFWTSAYKRYTNFGLQNFNLGFEGLRQLQLSTDTVYNFKVKRYAELLTGTHFVIQLPDIYSPILPPSCDGTGEWAPYEFKWIKNIGAMMIRSVRVTIGGNLIQLLTGTQMVALANRDLTTSQKQKWDQMVGNLPEVYDPGNAFGRRRAYPNAVYIQGGAAEPSIRGRQLRVPLPLWWGMTSQQAFPLTCLQYNELYIEVTLRPIRELFQIRDVTDAANEYPVVAPNFNLPLHQFYRFLQPPPNSELKYDSTSATTWNEGTTLSCTYAFLTVDEAKMFAKDTQHYLVKELYETRFHNVGVADKSWLQNSTSLVTSWTFMLQRSDVGLRNEWSNFTNWPYDYLPYDVQPLPITMTGSPCPNAYNFGGVVVSAGTLGYGLNPNGTESGLFGTGAAQGQNRRDILLTVGIMFDGAYREETRPAELYLYDNQYLASQGNGSVGLPGMYCYNFCLRTSPFDLQPSGAVNLSKYSKIELEYTTMTPILDPNSQYLVVCDAETGANIGVTKQTFQLYDYAYDLIVIEERFNVLTFMSGNAGLMNAR
jgi:hypothetical protein